MEEILKLEDKRTLATVEFRFPKLMNADAEELVKKEYEHFISLQDQLQKARENVRNLEEKVKKAQEEWFALQSIISYTYPTREKLVTRDTCSLTIKGHGNDIIGKTTVM